MSTPEQGKDRSIPPNLDLINMVQQARIAHDRDALPSQVAGVYWVEYKRETPGAAPTPRAGYFVIPTTVDEIDPLWARVKEATRVGALGYKSKASTAARTGGADRVDRVIHVVTYDGDDEADVERVRAGLRELGIGDVLEYVRVNG